MTDRQPSGLAELLTALLLTTAPLAGVGWILWRTSIFTVDSLFLILILLTISGVFALDLLLEFHQRFLKGAGAPAKQLPVTAAPAVAAGETRTEVGTVQSIQYFEAAVGQPNKSLVAFCPDGASTATLLTLCGNVQSQLQTGRRVQITYRTAPGCHILLSWNYL